MEDKQKRWDTEYLMNMHATPYSDIQLIFLQTNSKRYGVPCQGLPMSILFHEYNILFIQLPFTTDIYQLSIQ